MCGRTIVLSILRSPVLLVLSALQVVLAGPVPAFGQDGVTGTRVATVVAAADGHLTD